MYTDPRKDRPSNGERYALIMLLTIFFVSIEVSVGLDIFLIPFGVIAFASTWGLAHLFRNRPPSTWGILIGNMAFVLCFFMLSLPFGHKGRIATSLVIGALCNASIFATLRFPMIKTQTGFTWPDIKNGMKQGILWGCGFAGFITAIAAIRIAIASTAVNIEGLSEENIGLIIGGLFTGGIIGGSIIGPLQWISRWPMGTVLLGFIGAMCLYGTAMLTITMVDPAEGPKSFLEGLGFAAGIGSIVGPAVALNWRHS